MNTYELADLTAKAAALAILKATYVHAPALCRRNANGDFAIQYADEDKPDYIDFCLHHCPYASTECCNCLATAGNAKPGRPRKTEYI